ncbi:hypothetical protein LCGC14_1328260 [marine sediment metagenome]|uniref:Calcineurin-like phosphoesterase domain-containing protein n=1 Tax=marine sediment metagenome TaxID=412755 RepID=A0A0F9NJU1_9ZZZZ
MSRVCAFEGCSNTISKAKFRSKYCTDNCRKRNARLRYKRGESQAAVDATPSVEEQVEKERFRLEKNELARTLRELSRGEVKRKEYIQAIEDSLSSFTVSKIFPLAIGDKKTTVDWAIILSDWHIGQMTPIETTGGIYHQNLDISRRQVDKLLYAIGRIFHESEGKVVKNILLIIAGDIVEGDSMRPAQLRQIEIPVVKQTIEGFDLLAYFIRTLLQLPDLETLDIELVGGNHDRTTTKPGLAGLGETEYVDTFAWLIGAMLDRGFEDDPRVNVKNWETFFGFREFAGLRHVFEHGAGITRGGGGYGGIPFYPIVNTAQKHSTMLGGVDIAWFGHLHTPYTLPLGQEGRIIGNGALPATTAFVQSRYKTIRRPEQTLVEFHHKIGVTNIRPLYADVDLPKPGEVWEEL